MIGSHIAIAKCKRVRRGKIQTTLWGGNGHRHGQCIHVAGVAFVAENVHTQTLAALVESNTENEFKSEHNLLFTDRYLLYPSALSLG